MSINHISSDLPETLWWTQQHHHHHHHILMDSSTSTSSSKHHHHTSLWSTSSSSSPQLYHPTAATSNAMFCNRSNTAFSLNLNNEDDEELEEQLTDDRELINHHVKEEQEVHQNMGKEPMFEKPLTPSDVGKLNRLVIPKQHAEKYFPLNGVSESGDKGLLLSFEDESEKTWRFRYSYWNSSQSYVLTKGWSRFVKEKKLDAGDVVLFERHRLDANRLYIGWRRRTAAAAADGAQAAAAAAGGGGWSRMFYSSAGHPYPSHHQPQAQGPPPPYQPADCLHAGSIEQIQATPSTGNSKRLRLFGVNLECQTADESEPSTPDGSSTSSQGRAHYGQYQHYSKPQAYYNHHNHMDINFSRDVNQMRYRQG